MGARPACLAALLVNCRNFLTDSMPSFSFSLSGQLSRMVLHGTPFWDCDRPAAQWLATQCARSITSTPACMGKLTQHLADLPSPTSTAPVEIHYNRRNPQPAIHHKEAGRACLSLEFFSEIRTHAQIFSTVHLPSKTFSLLWLAQGLHWFRTPLWLRHQFLNVFLRWPGSCCCSHPCERASLLSQLAWVSGHVMLPL